MCFRSFYFIVSISCSVCQLLSTMSSAANLLTLLMCTIFLSILIMAKDFCNEFIRNGKKLDFAYGQPDDWWVEISENNWHISIDIPENQTHPNIKLESGKANQQLVQNVMVKFMIRTNVCGLKTVRNDISEFYTNSNSNCLNRTERLWNALVCQLVMHLIRQNNHSIAVIYHPIQVTLQSI